jgi:hypothetical protein
MTHRLPVSASWIAWSLLSAVSAGLYVLIARVSPGFEYMQPFVERPIPMMLALLGAAFAVYMLAALFAARWAPSRGQLSMIAGAAVLYRLILLPTPPIQEVDIYRYLWDGIVVSQGINPFRFPPQVVRDAWPGGVRDPQLASLVQLRDADPHIRTLLTRVHYAQLPTVYPPVSQAVFAAAAWMTPAQASIDQRILILKTWLLGFDLATGGLVLLLLRQTGRPLGLFVLYAWCPLVLKEFANSGHLDVIAVFLTTLALWLAVRSAACGRGRAGGQTHDAGHEPPTPVGRRGLNAIAGGVVLALAVGAKLYPIWLFPLFAALILRHLGWKWSLAGSVAFLATTVLVLWPLLPEMPPREPASQTAPPAAAQGAMASAATADPSRGLRVFLTRWEMNDFLFMIAMENVKPIDLTPAGRECWFSVVPRAPREALIGPLAERFGGDRWQAAFVVVRLASLLAALAIAIWCIRRAYVAADIAIWLESAFLTLAWFWFLSPTLNPWYWTWVLPLLALARSRVWWWMSGFVLMYYLRFWFMYHFLDTPVAGTPYAGAAFFDFIVSWWEFGPWLAWLMLDYDRRRIRSRRGGEEPELASC